MKAISINEPFFALSLAAGTKTIELRSWRTEHRGELLICASAAHGDDWLHDPDTGEYIQLPAGGMVGIVKIIDCRKATKQDKDAAMSDVPRGSYAWVCEPVCTVEPKKISGRLRLFDVPDELITRLGPDDSIFDYPVPQGAGKVTNKSTVYDMTPT